MADQFEQRIRKLQKVRKRSLAEMRRAQGRRIAALNDKRWEDARSAKRVVRRSRHEAQRARRDIAVIRRARKKASAAKRLIGKLRPAGSGLSYFDGVRCATWIARNLAKVRAAGRWAGRLVSGFRDPRYSTSLCYAMCGRPSCPGRCAGANSNHSGIWFPAGAADVSDYITFGAECRRLGLPLHNNLPIDRVHYSNSGH
jgi:hypothetical protein